VLAVAIERGNHFKNAESATNSQVGLGCEKASVGLDRMIIRIVIDQQAEEMR
jgi:hypothetical protein